VIEPETPTIIRTCGGVSEYASHPDFDESQMIDLSKEAYKELLMAPMTTDPRQYRLNIIMAYMMGQASRDNPTQ